MEIGFKGLHPFSSFLFFASVFSVTIFFSHPVLLSASFLCAVFYNIKLFGRKAVKNLFRFVLPLIILIAVINFVFSHYGVTTLFEMQNGNRFTLEALVYGLVFGIRTACVFLWLACFNEVISSDKFIFLFGRISPKTALVISMVLRFIPLFASRANEIEASRRGLGIDAKSGSFTARIKNSLHSISILVTWVLESAIDTASSMSARGYGLHGRKSYGGYIFTSRDAAIVFCDISSLILIVLCRKSFGAVYNPVFEIAAPNLTGSLAALFFVALCLLPPIYDIWEEKLWSM